MNIIDVMATGLTEITASCETSVNEVIPCEQDHYRPILQYHARIRTSQSARIINYPMRARHRIN